MCTQYGSRGRLTTLPRGNAQVPACPSPSSYHRHRFSTPSRDGFVIISRSTKASSGWARPPFPPDEFASSKHSLIYPLLAVRGKQPRNTPFPRKALAISTVRRRSVKFSRFRGEKPASPRADHSRVILRDLNPRIAVSKLVVRGSV